jgi:peptide/nickel transport system permease protein
MVNMDRKWIRALFHSADGLIGTVIVGTVVFMAVAAPLIAPYRPEAIDNVNRLKGPSAEHWFGTDEMGRDLFSRVIHGTRPSIGSALIVILLAGVGGSLLGLMAGFFGGRVDSVIMRLTDMFVGFPALILAVAVAAALGRGLFNGMLAVAVVWWPGYARLARGQVLSVKNLLYVEAAEAIGSPPWRTLLRHILPNSISPLLVKVTTDVGAVILYIASLGFLGLGAQPPSPEWGTMVADARVYLVGHWWFPTFPGLALMTTVIGFNLLGDALQSAFDVSLLEP